MYVHTHTHTHTHTLFFIPSSSDGHLGCFYVLTIINNAGMNIGVYVSFELVFLVFSDIYPRVEIYGSSIFSFFVKPPHCFPQWLH